MAQSFNSSDDTVDCGSGTTIDDLNPVTWWVLGDHVSGTFDRLMSKQTSGNLREFMTSSGGDTELEVIVSQNGGASNMQAITNDTAYGTGWRFAAVTYDSSADPRCNIYSGTLSTPATLRTLGTSVNNASTDPAPDADASGTLHIGNRHAGGSPDRAFNGNIACAGVIARAMSLGELVSLQFRPRVVADTRGFWVLGVNGVTTVPDWSGNGNVGTPGGTNKAVVDHAPLGPLFGADHNWVGAFGAAAAPASAFAQTMRWTRRIVPSRDPQAFMWPGQPFLYQEYAAEVAAGGTTPKGPFGHPFSGPFGGPI